MSGCLSLSSYKMDVENNIMSEEQHCPNPLEKNGIVTILNSDFANFTTPKISTPLNINTIRRTLSADMSSEIRDQSDGFPLKRVQSSEQLEVLGAHENNEEIVNDDNKGSGLGGRAFEDIWSSILSQKKSIGAGSSNTAPYVPPLMKRESSLSEKSLEICTESLGSETGWDGFWNPLPDYGEDEKLEDVVDTKECVEVIKCDNTHIKEADRDTKYKSLVNNKKINVGALKTFPPPLPSLIDRDDGSNLHMRTRREDGRLVLEAVAVIPSRNRFCALREDGRLLLTLTNDDDQKEQEEQEVVNDDDLDFEADEPSTLPYMTKDVVVARSRPFSAMTMSKLMELASSRNKSTWPRTSNMTFIRRSLDEYEDSEKKDSIKVEPTRVKSVSQSLPPRPKVSTASPAASMLNAYEYYWRQTSTPIAAGVAVLKPLAGKRNQSADTASPQVVKEDNKRVNKFLLLGNNNGKVGAQEEVVLVGGEKGEYHVPYLRGSNEAKRSHFFWDPYCIELPLPN